MKKLVCGVGINDADYAVTATVDGRRVTCEFYRAWHSMLSRCYSEKIQTRKPTYIGCQVCDEWLVFSNFKNWMELQDYEGNQLDKDILIYGNKVYSPNSCVFVSRQVNTLLNDRGAARGRYKQGVCFKKETGRFIAKCHFGTGIKRYLGCHDTENEAYAAYVKFKAAHIREVADTQEPKVKAGLYRHAEALEKTLDELK